MELSRVEVVLVRPSLPANVAAAARAMKNMGLRRLWLVDPPAGLEKPEARALAYGSQDVLDGAKRASSLQEAVAGSVFVAGTTGRDDVRGGTWTPRRLAAEAARRVGEGRLSLVFGPEASGLPSRELDLCHVLVRAPTDAAQPSLNLAQAVLLLAYELRLAALGVGEDSSSIAPEAVTAGELEQALEDLRGALLEVGYLDPLNPDHILTELRRLLARARPTSREVTLLRGLARQIAWAGRIARSRVTAP
jgi:tRNA/rRNA methyltransferase